MIWSLERSSVGLGFGGEVTTCLQRPRNIAQPVLTSSLWGLVSSGMCSWKLMIGDLKHLGLGA